MADINLLQNTTTEDTGKKTQGVLNVVGIILLVLVVVAYGGLFYLTRQATGQSTSELAEQNNVQQAIVSSPDYKDFLAHQSKLNNLDLLMKNHLSWCMIVPDFAKNSLKVAKYTKFTAGSDGSTKITGTVPDFNNLAKMIQAFQLNNGKFIKDVNLVNVGLSSGEKNDITYTINVTFDKTVLNTYPDTCS